MKAVWFRVIGQDGQPTGHVGFASGRDMVELFWAVDEYVDPYAVEVKPASMAGFCVKYVQEDEEVECVEHEITDRLPFPDDEGWKKPVWPDKVV